MIIASVCSVKTNTYSKSKYLSVLGQCGGWSWFQQLLTTLDGVAKRHDSSIANVASRWVLDKPTVAGVIVGARNSNHVADHQKLMQLEVTAEDRNEIANVLADGRQAQGDVYSWERGGTW